MLHGPGHSSKECKVLKVYSKNHGAQRPFKDKEARSVGNKSTKTARFDDTTQEVNTVKYHDDRILKKKKGKNQKKNPKSDQDNVEPSDDERIYGIDRTNFGEPAHDS